MPIRCNVSVNNLSQEDFRDLDYRVMRHAFDSQNELGRLADERIYQADLAARLRSDGLTVRREVEVQVFYRDYSKSLFLDLMVAEQGIYELKVVDRLTKAHVAQLLTYLQLLNVNHGKIVNFRSNQVESQFINAPMDGDQRRTFTVDDQMYSGDGHFRELVVGMIWDWGTSLNSSIYEEATVELLGGNAVVEAMLPLNRYSIPLGTQRFRLAGPDTAFKFTTINKDPSAYETQLTKLLKLSSLKAIHWINIAHHQLTLATILAK